MIFKELPKETQKLNVYTLNFPLHLTLQAWIQRKAKNTDVENCSSTLQQSKLSVLYLPQLVSITVPAARSRTLHLVTLHL